MEVNPNVYLEECPVCRGNGYLVHEGGWNVQVECADCSAHTVYVEYSNEKTEIYEVTEFTADNKAADTDVAETKTKLWEKALTFEEAGKYKVTAYSYVNGQYSEDGKSMEIYVAESSDPKVPLTAIVEQAMKLLKLSLISKDFVQLFIPIL